MWKDAVVDEIRQIRDEHARKFNYDLHAICEDFRKKQLTSGHPIVSRQPRTPQRSQAASVAISNE